MIKSIKTEYKGVLFRSKLEAQWAKFFDAEGISWIYEPEGYEFEDGTKYLPDFWLPDSGQYFEVKGVMKALDLHKIELLIKQSGRACIIGNGDGSFIACNYWGSWHDLATESESALVTCKKCGKKWFMGSAGLFTCQCCGEYDGDHHIGEWKNPWNIDWYKKAQIQIYGGKRE